MSDKKEKRESEKAMDRSPSKPSLLAKKAFVICQNEYLREIQIGDDLSDVPAIYHPNLKTEGII